MIKRLWSVLFLLLKWLWKWKIVRIFSGLILCIAGIFVMITIGWWTPGPSGILLLIPGLVILMMEFHFIERLVVAFFAWRFTRRWIVFCLRFRFRDKPVLRVFYEVTQFLLFIIKGFRFCDKPFLMRIYGRVRVSIFKRTDFRFSFKKHGWRKK